VPDDLIETYVPCLSVATNSPARLAAAAAAAGGRRGLSEMKSNQTCQVEEGSVSGYHLIFPSESIMATSESVRVSSPLSSRAEPEPQAEPRVCRSPGRRCWPGLRLAGGGTRNRGPPGRGVRQAEARRRTWKCVTRAARVRHNRPPAGPGPGLGTSSEVFDCHGPDRRVHIRVMIMLAVECPKRYLQFPKRSERHAPELQVEFNPPPGRSPAAAARGLIQHLPPEPKPPVVCVSGSPRVPGRERRLGRARRRAVALPGQLEAPSAE
jgi:hypothetical protein